MKIVFVTECLGSGGAERQMVNLAIMMKNYGHSVHVLTWDSRDFYKRMLDDNKVPNNVVAIAKKKYLRSFTLSYCVRKMHPDVVISFLPGANIALCIGRLLGIIRFKLIISERNFTLNWSWRERMISKLYKVADLLITNSEAERKNYISNCEYPTKKICTIHNFVDTDYFKPSEDKCESESILVISRIRNYKNTHGMLTAVKILKDKGYAFKIIWVGHDYKDTYSDYIKQKIKDLNIEDIFILVAPNYDVLKFYQNASVFCLPSFREGYPNVIIEAMSCGLPILCSNVCENPYIVVDNINGFLFNPYDTSDIVRAFEVLFMQSDSKRFEMGYRNREKMLKNNTSKEFFEKYNNVIENMLFKK